MADLCKDDYDKIYYFNITGLRPVFLMLFLKVSFFSTPDKKINPGKYIKDTIKY